MGRFLLLEERTLAALLIGAGVMVGFFWGEFASLMEPHVLQALFVIGISSLLPFGLAADRSLFKIEFLTWQVVIWQQFLVPSMVFVFGLAFGVPAGLLSLLLVAATAGSLFASPTILRILELNYRRGVQCMALSTMVLPLSLFVFLGLLHGPNLQLDLLLYIERIVIFMVVPLFIVWFVTVLVTDATAPVKASIARVSRWISVAALAVFGAGMMHEVGERWAVDPRTVLELLGIASVAGIVMFVATIAVMTKFGLHEGLTAAVLGTFRNVGLSFALVGGTLGPDLALFVGIIIIPAFLAPLVIRLVQTIVPRISPADAAAIRSS